MTQYVGIQMRSPCHVGEFIKYEIIEAHELTIAEAANRLGVEDSELSALCAERVALSQNMAAQIERVFRVSMRTLLRMQKSYDVAQERMREERREELNKINRTPPNANGLAPAM